MLNRIKSLTVMLLVSVCSLASASEISGAGSSAAKPLYLKWAEAYHKTIPIDLAYQPVGSSAGIKQIKAKQVDFGASDVALSPEELKKHNLINFPSAISGVVPFININGIKKGELLLTGEVLADIFSRKITHWNDPAIGALNPNLPLPKMPIMVVVRSDGSGTTYNFTDYLSKVSPAWRTAFGNNFTIAWPTGTLPAKGSSGVVAAVKETPGAIGYVDYNYVTQEHLAYTMLKNRDGKAVAPLAASFEAALNNSRWKSSGAFEEMLTNLPGAQSWPITMGTFIVMPQTTPNTERTIAVLKFFSWTFINGDYLCASLDFVRLPDAVQARVFRELTKISDASGKRLAWSPI
jgi:phosphate transport system substrate-binding protein